MNLLVIDPYVTKSTPSMRAWVEAYPAFEDLFDGIEIWATATDLPVGGKVSFTGIPQRIATWSLHALDFKRRATRRLEKTPPSINTVVLTTGCNVPRADIRYMHFWHHAMLAELAARPGTFKLSWPRRWLSAYVAKSEREVLRDAGSTGSWWVVSRSIGEKIAADGGRGEFRVLPNAYDGHRFSPGIRAESRQSMRKHYGFSEEETVFVFSSFGHFERKGLTQAVEAVALLQASGHKVRLLVLGGEPAGNQAFIRRLERRGVSCGFCVFAGRVDQIEKHLSAGDAFLFPSHFEAFSLAEIEAGALGLRLYLTPHYGSEMILRPPSNGQFLPWDSAGMAKVLERDLISGQTALSHGEMGEALPAAAFSLKIRGLFEEAIASKKLNGKIGRLS